MKIQRFIILLVCLVWLGGCKKGGWLAGQWLLISPEGRPGSCHEFKKDGTFTVYLGSDCAGDIDPMLSGKWEFKEETKLAILRGKELQAHLAYISEKTEENFQSNGVFTGSFHRLEKKSGKELIKELESKGVIKVKPLPVEIGCNQLGMTLSKIKALPKEKEPRFIRGKDQYLEFHVQKTTGIAKIEKTVFALNQGTIEWIAFHLSAEAFRPPGPHAFLESYLGKPTDTAATGGGESRQHIAMWRTYCEKIGGTSNKDVDVTLFATTGEQRGTFYVSENIVSGLWEELKQTAASSAAAAPAETSEESEEAPTQAPPPAAAPEPKAAPAKAAPPPKRPKAKAKPKPPKPAKAPAPKAGDDDEI